MAAEMRPLGEPGPAFDPRLAALTHAGLGELANAVACGLVYVGDQIGKLAQPVGPRLTFDEIRPAIQKQAVEWLREVHGRRAEGSIVDAVLNVAGMIIDSNGGCRGSAGDE